MYGKGLMEQWECTGLYRLFPSVDNRSDRWQVYLSSGRRLVDEKRDKATWFEKGRSKKGKEVQLSR